MIEEICGAIGVFLFGVTIGALAVMLHGRVMFADDTEPASDGFPPMESLDHPVEEMKTLAEFPIAGKPRRVPWAVKRREIEQQHRTKRKRMEEWI